MPAVRRLLKYTSTERHQLASTSDSFMAARRLRCAIEQVVDWHPHLFVEPHTVAFVAVASKYSSSPARFDVECHRIRSKRLSGASEFRLDVFWHNDTAEKAERMRATMQSRPIVELAAVAVALLLCHRVARFGRLDVTDYGARADYRARKQSTVLEISGTELLSEFARRQKEKVAQALANPFRWDAHLVVCLFSASGHRIRFSRHSIEEAAQ
jgi:hypothetical protein